MIKNTAFDKYTELTKEEKINSVGGRLQFISNAGPGTLFYNTSTHQYTWQRNRTNFSYAWQVIQSNAY